MKRLVPSSLLGQVMISVALALLVAQIVSFALLYRAGEERRDAAILTAAAYQIVNGAERTERQAGRVDPEDRFDKHRSGQSRRGERRARREPSMPRGLPRPLRYTVSSELPIVASETNITDLHEERLRTIFAIEDINPHAIIITIRRAGEDPVLLDFAQGRPRFNLRTDWHDRRLYVAAIQREPDSEWETARVLDPTRKRAPLGMLLFQTFVAFGFLIAILFLVLRRITRPLAELTDRVSDFSRQPDRVVVLKESGPSDTRRLIAAHNAMESRIAAMLDEKNVMLGAIGHDLKTPLAALRVRIESVPDDAQRQKMADSIEDIAATLDDILALARVGHAAGQGLEPVDVGALAISVVEEFEDLGDPVAIVEWPEQKQRVVARIQETWLKRALRNLVCNAVRYGGSAELSVLETDGHVVLRVEDHGPGIPPDQIAHMMEPFTRGEASRNRATGGAGLGLTLARAIAEQHGGELVLSNRNADDNAKSNHGGLRAELRLPL